MDDRLGHMFTVQSEFQQRLAYIADESYPPTQSEHLVQAIAMTAYALCDEIHEATSEVGWKPWASSNHINREAYLGEIVDAWHFFMNLCLLVGITPAELYEGYMQKVAINHQRQDSGYTGVKEKCPRCKRAYDDPAIACTRATDKDPAWCRTGLIMKMGKNEERCPRCKRTYGDDLVTCTRGDMLTHAWCGKFEGIVEDEEFYGRAE